MPSWRKNRSVTWRPVNNLHLYKKSFVYRCTLKHKSEIIYVLYAAVPLGLDITSSDEFHYLCVCPLSASASVLAKRVLLCCGSLDIWMVSASVVVTHSPASMLLLYPFVCE